MEMSKTYQYRKVMKPMLERQRRARINKYLDQLKDLMVDCLKQDNEHIIRLEKADILEYTVQYLQKTKHHHHQKQQQQQQQQQSLHPNNPVQEIESFRNGYIHAANEVSRVLASTHGIDIELGTNLMTHLGHKLNHIEKTVHNCLLTTTTQINKQSKNYNQLLEIETNTNELSTRTQQSSASSSSISPASSGYCSDSSITSASSSNFNHNHNKTTEKKQSNCCWRPWSNPNVDR